MSEEILKNVVAVVVITVLLSLAVLGVNSTFNVRSDYTDGQKIDVRIMSFTDQITADNYIGHRLPYVRYTPTIQFAYDLSNNTCTIIQIVDTRSSYESHMLLYLIDNIVSECLRLKPVKVSL